MTLTELMRQMYSRPAGQQTDPVYVPALDYFTIQAELGERLQKEGKLVLCKESEYPNFLLCGCEVRPK